MQMAETMPPDRNARAGKKRGSKSGKVADFRYKRAPQSEMPRKPGRDGRGRGNPNPSGPAAPARAKAEQDLAAIGTVRTPHQGEAYAALDLGTNNCRLLIARPSGRDFTVIDAFSRVVKLGEGLATSGRLSDAAMDRSLAQERIWCQFGIRSSEAPAKATPSHGYLPENAGGFLQVWAAWRDVPVTA